MRAQISNRDYETISAYLDGQLSSVEMSRLEEKFRTNPDWREALDELGQTRAVLRSAPRLRAPRSFVLTPAMIAEKPQRRNFFSLFPVLSFTSAIATLAIVFSFIFGSATGSVNQSMATGFSPQTNIEAEMNTATETKPDTVEAPSAAMKEAAPTVNSRSGSQNAPVITWGFPQDNYSPSGKFPVGGASPVMGMGGGGGGGGGGSDLGFGGLGGGTFDGQLVIPYDESLPDSQEAVPGQVQESENFSQIPMLEGSGPILGLPSNEREGQYLQPLPTPIPDLPKSGLTSQSGLEPEVGKLAWLSPTNLWFLRIILGLTALITGGAAWWIWQRHR